MSNPEWQGEETATIYNFNLENPRIFPQLHGEAEHLVEVGENPSLFCASAELPLCRELDIGRVSQHHPLGCHACHCPR
jgi:hypothetical protein